jgi:hypothetical protein
VAAAATACSKLELSIDGTVLAAKANANDAPYDRTLKIFPCLALCWAAMIELVPLDRRFTA